MKILKINFKIVVIFVNLGSLFVLGGCETWTVGSKESLDAKEKRPWRSDESSVAGLENRPTKRITPRVSFNMPIDEPSRMLLKSREIPDPDCMGSFKTYLDKKNRSIKIILDKD